MIGGNPTPPPPYFLVLVEIRRPISSKSSKGLIAMPPGTPCPPEPPGARNVNHAVRLFFAGGVCDWESGEFLFLGQSNKAYGI